MSDPVKLHCCQIGVRELLQNINASWSLNRNLRVVIAEVLDEAVELARVITHPVEIFFSGARIDDQQVITLTQSMHNHIVDERSLGIKQRGILGLPDSQSGGVVHADVLDGEQGLRAYKADVPHVADIEDPNTVAYGIVFGNDATAGRIFNGHVPGIEFDHLGAHLAMHGV